jgi:tyrosyl-tRNA synthetase
VALTMPILVGPDGERKMSKSLGNCVGISEAPGEMFGKLMSISDELMWSYYELLTDFASPVIVRLREEVRTGVMHPKKAKMELAHNIVAGFHGEDAAKKAGESFERVYGKREAPEEIREIRLVRGEGCLIGRIPALGELVISGSRKWSQVLAYLKEVPSIAEGERIVKQGGLEIDGQVVTDPTAKLDPNRAASYELRIGKKKFLRIVVE